MMLKGLQLNAMVYWYSGLLKDKEIIAAEVLNEYNQGVGGTSAWLMHC